MSKEQDQQQRVPTVMQIIIAVGSAAGMTSDTLMGESRDEDIIRARAAVFKIADEHGHSYREIMFYINRNRTGAFNYRHKLRGHLQRDQVFIALCDLARLKLAKLKPRAIREADRQERQWRIKNGQPPTTTNAADKPVTEPEPEPARESEPQKPKRPQFKAWKGKLGWSFTAEEIEREYYAIREAERWFNEVYCKPASTPTYTQRSATKPEAPQAPGLLPTTDAALYLGISTDLLKKGVDTGHLHRETEHGTRGYLYHTSELDEYKAYLKEAGIIK